MKTWMAVTALAILAAGSQDAADEKEPPMIFFLEVDGKKTPIELDKAIDFETKKVTLRVEPHRVFKHGDITFHYPRGMSFEADMETPAVKMWNLDGNDVVIMVQRYEGNADPEAVRDLVTEGMVAQYGAANVKKEKSTLVLDKEELSGMRLAITLAGQKLNQSLYSFNAGKDSVMLILQDSPKEDGQATDEFKAALKMLQATFTLPK